MRNDVNKYITKMDAEERKKNNSINKHNTKIKKFEKKALEAAQKKYNNTYLEQLKKEIEVRGKDYEKKEINELISQVNSGELNIDLVKKINFKDKYYGKDINDKENEGLFDMGERYNS